MLEEGGKMSGPCSDRRKTEEQSFFYAWRVPVAIPCARGRTALSVNTVFAVIKSHSRDTHSCFTVLMLLCVSLADTSPRDLIVCLVHCERMGFVIHGAC